MIPHRKVWVSLVASLLLLPGCASMPKRDPLQVTVAGIEPQKGEGLEMRMMVKLRVQNPNDAAIDFNGVALQMDVAGKSFASGVSDSKGSVPRYGETVVTVPLTISTINIVQHAMSMMKGGGGLNLEKIQYELKGKLGGGGTSAERFAMKGEFDLAGLQKAKASD
jgi:LEA14-like dessication related protein